jgi:ElaB/YqjD/DUF883 family membrane-anchored ribosome-binding protein
MPENRSGSGDSHVHEQKLNYDALKQQAATVASGIKDKAIEVGKGALDKIDDAREPAAGVIESAASTLDENAGRLPANQSVRKAARETADKLHDTANYVRRHDSRMMAGDLGKFVKDHPGRSIAAAAVVGFLFGMVFRRD